MPFRVETDEHGKRWLVEAREHRVRRPAREDTAKAALKQLDARIEHAQRTLAQLQAERDALLTIAKQEGWKLEKGDVR